MACDVIIQTWLWAD